jgi:uncharacterized protein (TIGR02996 family)
MTRPLTPESGARLAATPSRLAPDVSELRELATVILPELAAPEERRRLDAVLAAPDADAPRLAFADYCDALGDPRGPFIRAHLADPATRVPPEFFAAAREVFAAVSGEDFLWGRGFVEGMSFAGRAFLAHGGWVQRRTPLRAIRLVALQPYLAELAACPHFAAIRTLDLRGNRVGPAGLTTLLPALTHVTGLNLAANNLTLADLPGLFALPRLQALDLSGNPLAVTAWPARHFDALALDGVGLGVAGAEALAASGVTGLSLDLGFNALTDAGVASLIGSPLLGRCQWLGLRGNCLTPAVREILVGFPGTVDLRANFL